MVKRRLGPTGSQAWRSFLQNQAKAMWSRDFFVQHTVGFRVVYVFVIMEFANRKVIHMHVIEHPTLEWTEQQVRNAGFQEHPRFLLHDNNGKFDRIGRPFRVENAGKKVLCRPAFDVWLWREMGIRGIPIPYGAPNAAAYIERLMGTPRRECLDRILIWSERHPRCVLHEFIGWYNRRRIHQGLNGIPYPDPSLADPKPLGGRLVAVPVLNGMPRDCRLAA
jgi:transposase InsO family protein